MPTNMDAKFPPKSGKKSILTIGKIKLWDQITPHVNNFTRQERIIGGWLVVGSWWWLVGGWLVGWLVGWWLVVGLLRRDPGASSSLPKPGIAMTSNKMVQGHRS